MLTALRESGHAFLFLSAYLAEPSFEFSDFLGRSGVLWEVTVYCAWDALQSINLEKGPLSANKRGQVIQTETPKAVWAAAQGPNILVTFSKKNGHLTPG